MAGLQKAGVEAVVEGLSSFLGDVDTMNSKIGEIGQKGNLLTRALGGAWEMLGNLGQSVVHVAEYALGQLLANAVGFVTGKIGELVSATIEAGAEFQTMELRLNRLNFNAASDSLTDYDEAMAQAQFMTQQQLNWVQKLAVTTPYDAQDIANVFTLAQSYGFAADEAKTLTRDISDFAAGMGLGNTEIERIIVNFGQMVQQGKVTQREMNDLARGAFVPVNDVLDIMKEKTGLTGGAFDKFRNSAEGVNLFMESFSQLVETKFKGSAEDMSKTFAGATANAQDFVKSLLGFGIVRPVLAEVGSGIASLISSLTQPERWDALTKAAGRVGDSFSLVFDIFNDVMDLNVDGVADGIVSGLNGIADWVSQNRGKIYEFFQNTKQKIMDVWDALKSGDFGGFLKALGLDDIAVDKILEFKDTIVGMFETISGWVETNGPLIEGFFNALGQIMGGVFENFTGNVDAGGGLTSFLEMLKSGMEWVIDHQENLISFITLLVFLQGVLALVGFAFALIAGPVLAFIGFLLAVGTLVVFVVSVLGLLLTPIGLLVAAIVGVVIAWQIWGDYVLIFLDSVGTAFMAWIGNVGLGFQYVGQIISEWFANVQIGFQYTGEVITAFLTSMGAAFGTWFASMISGFQEFVAGVVAKFNDLSTKFANLISAIISRIQNVDWGGIGASIIQGIAEGVRSAVGALVEAVSGAVSAAVGAAQEALQIQSPSKVFAEMGEQTMEGMAIGITRMAHLARESMVEAMAGVTAPAFSMSGAAAQAASGNTTNNNYNYALTVNSAGTNENILQDYGMMQSLSGA